jgi:hypothetical protein
MLTAYADQEVSALAHSVAGLWKPEFPSAELVSAAAALIPSVREAAGPTAVQTEGPQWTFVIAPGALQVKTKDWGRAARTQERDARRQVQGSVWNEARGRELQREAVRRASPAVPWAPGISAQRHLKDLLEQEFQRPVPRREITGWSRKSRCNMRKTFAQLDYSEAFGDSTRPACMVTLTYPGDWLTVAPNGAACKVHLEMLRKRYQRAFGEDLVCLWKQEFQRRGAPHFHLLMVPPVGTSEDGQYFRQWLSINWAAVVNHPDPEQHRRHVLAGTAVDWAEGLKSTDPKRVADYFAKHGSFAAKEYQNCVPEAWRKPGQGPGRFWGYWGLEPARVGVRVSASDGVKLGRLLRRWARAQGVTRQATVRRVRGGAATSAYTEVIGLAGATVLSNRKVRYRHSRVRAKRLPTNRGWVSVNDGAEFASQIARWLSA